MKFPCNAIFLQREENILEVHNPEDPSRFVHVWVSAESMVDDAIDVPVEIFGFGEEDYLVEWPHEVGHG